MDPLPQAAAQPLHARAPLLEDIPPRAARVLPVAAIGNAPAADPIPPSRLDLSDAWAVPWDGAGSNMAVRATNDAGEWRVKSTGDSGVSAMEVTMAKLFRLTGLAVPQMALADAIDFLPGDAWMIASRLEPRFQDLGAFLASAQAEQLIARHDDARRQEYLQLRTLHDTALTGCSNVLERAGVEQFWQLRAPAQVQEHAMFDRQRFDALEAMNRMLPPALRADQVRHFVASRWLDNWDHLNYRMENFGYTERDGQPVGMTVDMGSCGPLGFRNLRSGAMMPKHASADVALVQRPASLFPIPDTYSANAPDFDAMAADPGLLQDTLRWPYGFQSDSVAEMIRPPVAPEPETADALAEMGYRLSLLPASAITALVTGNWQVPADARPEQWPRAAELAGQLCERRDHLLRRYDPAQLRDWISADADRADRVRQQVLDALAEVLGADVDIDTHRGHIMQAHRACARGVMPSGSQAINGTTWEVRSLQQLHDCCQRLQAALAGRDDTRIAAIAEELVSPAMFSQMLASLELGPGAQTRNRAAFAANSLWMMLVTRLLQDGRLSPARVADRLLGPVEGSAYPPNIGAHAKDHPDMGMGFLALLETLMRASAELTPAQLRERLLASKIVGFPNFYSALAASGAPLEWDERLRQADLLPTTSEYVRLRSLWSLTMMKINQASKRSNEPIRLTAEQQSLAVSPLGALLEYIDSLYGPQRIAEMELPLLREKVYATMALTTGEEDTAIDDSVAQAVSDAWKTALSAHRLSSSIPVPATLLREQQQAALRDYRKTMRGLRRADAEALIVQGERQYLQTVLDNPQMSMSDRRERLRQQAGEVTQAIRDMVRDCAGLDAGGDHGTALDSSTHGHVTAAVTRAARQVAATVQSDAQAQAQARAAVQASLQARQSAQSHAAEQVRKAVPSTAAAAAAMHVQAAAAKAAQKHAADKAAHQAASRAARDAAINNSQFQHEVTTRLALLRAPEVQGGASASRQTTAQIAQRLTALQDDRLEARLRALRDPPAAAGASAGRTRIALREKK